MNNYPLTLIALPETTDLPRSIEAKDRKQDTLFVVWSDGRATINGKDLYIEEVAQLQLIAQNFYLFYNNIKTQKL